ncbi:MAG: malto-oligosyltrehalose synthase [Dechloromonas sp.]|nr:malto-oligosyltrehalose synthase [Dechloromonas sp.]
MTRRDAIRRLAAGYGIAADYIDWRGERRETSDATREKLLAALGVELDGDPAELAEQLETRDWRRPLPPVQVLWAEAGECAIAVTLPAAGAQAEWQWTLNCEAGERQTGRFRPAALPLLGERRLAGNDVQRRRLALPPLGIGYHRLELAPLTAEQGAGGATQLIVAPARCYCPPALHGDGRAWGPTLQLYSLRSRRNWGIGDFTDLRAVVALAAEAGGALVGLNPLHALFPEQPARCSPYSPSSRLFLNVLYIDVEAVADFQASAAARALVAAPDFQARLRALQAGELVDYAAVAAAKLAALRLAFADFRSCQLLPGTPRAQAWRRFRTAGGAALEQHARFEALQADFHAADQALWGWPAWPAEFRSPEAAAVHAYAAEHAEEIEFHIYLQWLADEQLAAATRRAGQAGAPGLAIGLYQDLALGIDPGGAEAWSGQAWYARGVHLGAPPDDFSRDGQDWGLLPLLPERLRETAYAPFIATLRAAMRHAGALRLDHVMALQRVFWVPAGESPAAGAYVSYHFDELLGILALESWRHCCAVVGEDLGTVPDGLRATLAEHGVLSYRPLFFERGEGGSFRPPAAYPRQALAVVATHDMPTLYGFWQGRDIDTRAGLGLLPAPEQLEAAVVARAEDRARLLLALQREGLLPDGNDAPVAAVPAMTPALAQAVYAYLARSPAMLLGVQVEDIFGVVDQANLPGTTAPHPNWRRRLPLELDAWAGEPRWRALAEMLRGERGQSAAPEPGVVGAAARGAAKVAEIPRATYRLQLNRDFTLAQATVIVPYLAELGISHCYLSPCLKARPGSSHGYDIVDYNAFNPEIGTAEDFRHFTLALHGHGMGLILDFVPNHMGVGGADNDWWLDVLENGPAAAHADYFDIDWQPLNPELQGKVLLPILGDHYGTVLGRGELQLAFDAERGEFSLYYYAHRLPLDPAGYGGLIEHRFERLSAELGAGDQGLLELQSLATAFGHLPARHDGTPARRAERQRDKEVHKRHLAALCAAVPAIAAHLTTNLAELNGAATGNREAAGPANGERFDALHALIKAQAYRLAYWRVAADEINYRRFFDQNDLAAVRMENPEVFAACHRLVLSLIDQGLVQGLRIDHADGLYDPGQYFRRLQGAVGGGDEGRPVPRRRRRLPLYLVIEKILAGGERLAEDWPIHGATGYRFANLVNGLFVDAAAEQRMSRIYAEFTGERSDFDELEHDAKKLIIRWSLQGELNVLASQLSRIAAASRHTCDFTLNGLRAALAEVVACFPVYRSYFAAGHLSTQDRRLIERAVAVAKRRSPAADISVFDFVRAVLTGDLAVGKNGGFRELVRTFAMKFQQYTAPVMAKGMEDTAFYRYHRLVSLNDVGGDPRRFGVTPAAFHALCRARAQRWPHSLSAGSTHDSKRAEDVRARIDVLSEIPAAWKVALNRWRRLNRSRKRLVDGQPAPSRNDEYLIYQTLFGTWPLAEVDDATLADYRQRIAGYLLKAVREAKEHSSWINVNADYEAALVGFVEALLAPGPGNLFLADFAPATRRLAHFGLLNGLAQTLLKLTAPGVPDIYQGCELWQFNLVDPDNRRPVDFAARQRWLDEVRALTSPRPDDPAAGWGPALRELAAGMADGRLKLYLTWCALQWRRRWPEVFRDGDYLPLPASGRDAAHVCAYARRLGERTVVTVVPRLDLKRQGGRGTAAAGRAAWGDTRIEMPSPLAVQPWFNVLTGQVWRPAAGAESGAPEALALDHLLEYFPVALLASGPDALPEEGKI